MHHALPSVEVGGTTMTAETTELAEAFQMLICARSAGSAVFVGHC